MKTLQYYRFALRDLPRHGILKFLVIPGVLAVLIATGLYYLVNLLAHPLEIWLAELYPFDLGKDSVGWITGYFSELVSFVLFIFLFKYILFVVMSPFMSHLSEEVERDYYTDMVDRKFSLSQALRDMWRGINMSLRSVVKEGLLSALILLLSLIPGAQIVTAPLLFLVQSYYAGLGAHDFTLERFKSAGESVRWGKSNRISVTLIGAVFVATLMIPYLGALIAMPLVTIASAHHYFNKTA